MPIDLGRSTREPSEGQRRAVAALWPTCAHPSCDRPFAWTQLHHIIHWTAGAPTDIANLLPLCCRHHTLHHNEAFDISRRPDGTIEFWRPDGTFIGTAHPTLPDLLAPLRDLEPVG